jgi:hypothetical protein
MPGHLGYRVPVGDRFMAKVLKRADGCWEWTGMRLKGRNLPYGYLWVEGKMVRAHRLAHELFMGPIPADGVGVRASVTSTTAARARISATRC